MVETAGRGTGPREPSSQRVGIGTVAPACALVQEAISANLDSETTPLTETEIARHLALCPACRAFAADASALAAHVAAPEAPSSPAGQLLATVATARRSARTAALAAVIVRMRARLTSPGVVPWTFAAMAVGVVLPSVSLATLAHVQAAHPHLHDPCANLLFRHYIRTP